MFLIITDMQSGIEELIINTEQIQYIHIGAKVIKIGDKIFNLKKKDLDNILYAVFKPK